MRFSSGFLLSLFEIEQKRIFLYRAGCVCSVWLTCFGQNVWKIVLDIFWLLEFFRCKRLCV